MSISSIGGNSWYSSLLSSSLYQNTNSKDTSTNSLSTVLREVLSNIESTETAQAVTKTRETQNGKTGNGEKFDPSEELQQQLTDMQTLYDKLEDGSVTSDDLTSVIDDLTSKISRLQDMTSTMTSTATTGATTTNSASTAMQDELAQDLANAQSTLEALQNLSTNIQAGTSTEDELTNAASLLSNEIDSTQTQIDRKPQGPPPPPPGGMSFGSEDDEDDDTTESILEYLQNATSTNQTLMDYLSSSSSSDDSSSSSTNDNEYIQSVLNSIITAYQNFNNNYSNMTEDTQQSFLA